jgi:hypothetical protein
MSYQLIITLPDHHSENEARQAASDISEAGMLQLTGGELDVDFVEVRKAEN